MVRVFAFDLDLNWELLSKINQIERFDASWTSIKKKESQSLKQLITMATVQSVGASTRIEGSQMSDKEVDTLLQDLTIDKLTDGDTQEVAGYYEAFRLIFKSFPDISITESSIKNLHKILLKYSEKDEWHRGDYKLHSNHVEVSLLDGTKQIIFRTTPPGYPTQDAVNALVEWYKTDKTTHPLVKSALFSYELVTIHPFQDGNGRLSRLFAILLLLKSGYQWIQYVSLEHEIENKKNDYYLALRTCHAGRPNENVTPWVNFFCNSLVNIQDKLKKKLERTGAESKFSLKDKAILAFISEHQGCKSGDIAGKLAIPSPTVKRILKKLVDLQFIEMHGKGPGTNYSME